LEKYLPPRYLVTRPFPSTLGGVGDPGTFVTYQAGDSGQPYWAMTYGYAGPRYLIRVFSDRRVEIEEVTPTQQLTPETVR
jgi:hypothetical protein